MFCMFNEVEDKLLQLSRKQVIHETLLNQIKKIGRTQKSAKLNRENPRNLSHLVTCVLPLAHQQPYAHLPSTHRHHYHSLHASHDRYIYYWVVPAILLQEYERVVAWR